MQVSIRLVRNNLKDGKSQYFVIIRPDSFHPWKRSGTFSAKEATQLANDLRNNPEETERIYKSTSRFYNPPIPKSLRNYRRDKIASYVHVGKGEYRISLRIGLESERLSVDKFTRELAEMYARQIDKKPSLFMRLYNNPKHFQAVEFA